MTVFILLPIDEISFVLIRNNKPLIYNPRVLESVLQKYVQVFGNMSQCILNSKHTLIFGSRKNMQNMHRRAL